MTQKKPNPERDAARQAAARLKELFQVGKPNVRFPQIFDIGSGYCTREKQYLITVFSSSPLPDQFTSVRDVFRGIPVRYEVIDNAGIGGG